MKSTHTLHCIPYSITYTNIIMSGSLNSIIPQQQYTHSMYNKTIISYNKGKTTPLNKTRITSMYTGLYYMYEQTLKGTT